MPRPWIWLQLVIGWVPFWAVVTTQIVTVHGARPVDAALIGLRLMVAAAVLGLAVRRVADRFPWPHPFRLGFVAIHLVTAFLYAVAWVGLNSAIESLVHARLAIAVGPGIVPFVTMGIWLYVMIAGVTYAIRATERAARAEAIAARSQLAALRGQLNPHFLFNALHTVVQLIPREPGRAGQAAEQVAGLLRTTLEEDRDLVSLGEELAFVERYLEVERLRFGERLRVRVDVTDDARGVSLPAFALQTLVENAVRHGAAPRVEPTDLTITGRLTPAGLRLTVQDTGAGPGRGATDRGSGTGLARLRERLAVLYDVRGRLELAAPSGGGFVATLLIPGSSDE